MSIREIYLPHLNRTVKLGRREPVAQCPRLRLSKYLTASLPTPPATCDYTAPAMTSLSQMYLNDELGNCVIACMAHVEGVLTANSGSQRLFSPAEIVSLYSAIGGYNPNAPLVMGPNGPENPTDQGCDEQTALNYWQRTGAGGDKILGWLALDPTNPTEYRTAIWLFENAVYGIPLPDAWLRNPQPGFVWDAAPPDQRNGHCVAAFGYGSNSTLVSSWGMLGHLTDAAHRHDVQEMYVVLSQNSIAKATAKAPNGLDIAALIADFDALGGTLPVPTPPAPIPVPPMPTPPSPTPNPISSKVAFVSYMAKALGLPTNEPAVASQPLGVG